VSGLFYSGDNESHRYSCRNHCNPQYKLYICEPQHQQNGQRRAKNGPHRIHRLAQPKAGPTDRWWRDIGDEGVSRRTTNTFSDSIQKACSEDHFNRVSQREKWLGQGRQPIPKQQKSFTPANEIADGAREYLDEHGGRLGDPFDDPDSQCARAQRGDQKYGHQAVYKLGR